MLRLYLLEPNARRMGELTELCECLAETEWDIQVAALARTEQALIQKLDDGRIPALFIISGAEKTDEVVMRMRRQNSLHYLVLLLDTPSEAMALRPAYYRAAGFLLRPVGKEAWMALMAGIYADFQTVCEAGDMFTVRVRGAVYPVAYRDILYFESAVKKVFLRTAAQEFEFYGSLEDISVNAPEPFLRVHRGFCVNMRHVCAVKTEERLLVLTDGSNIPFSRTCKAALGKAIYKTGR